MPIQSCRQFVSDVIGGLRSLSIDDRIPSRLVLSIGRDYTRTFIKQDGEARRLFDVSEVWKSIPCFHLCEEDATTCGGDLTCETLMKSELALPSVYDSSYGNLIKVFTINGEKEYKKIKISEYKDIKSREYSDPNQRYYWILDNHIYIPDSKVQEVMVVGLFIYPNEVTKIVEGDECLFPLDEYLPVPGYLLGTVKDATIKKLAEIYKRIVPDVTPDENPNHK